MSETEPSMNINLGADTKFEMTRRNSSLYTFLGQAAIYNHVFLIRDDLPPIEDGLLRGTYLFEQVFKTEDPELEKNNVYKIIMGRMIAQQYPLHLNQSQPAQCDIDAFNSHFLKDLASDGFPEEWENGE